MNERHSSVFSARRCSGVILSLTYLGIVLGLDSSYNDHGTTGSG
jgi:hypothetical protein